MSILMPTATQTATYDKIDRAAKLMVLYPVVYIVLTLPLSAGRMWSMAHGGVGLPDAYSCLAGALIASTGFVDALLYTLTRKQLLKHSTPSAEGNAASTTKTTDKATGWFKGSGSASANKSALGKSAIRQPINQLTSWHNMADGGITQTRTVTVVGQRASSSGDDIRTHNNHNEPAYEMSERRQRSRSGSADPIMPSTYVDTHGPGLGYDTTKKSKTEVSVSVSAVERNRNGSSERSATIDDAATDELTSDEEGEIGHFGTLKTEKE